MMVVEQAQDPVMQELVEGLNQLTTSRYLCSAALVLSIYDWLLLAGDESLTIWKTKWSLPKTIYYFNRIVTPLGIISATFDLTDLRTSPLSAKYCHVSVFINSLVQLLSFFLSNLLLTLRLVALYRRRKWVIWFLYTFLAISYLSTAGLMGSALYIYGQTIQYSIIFHACSSSTRPSLMPSIYLAPMAFECTIFVMTAISAWKDAKIMTGPGSAPFLKVLYRDGMICFVVMFGVRIWNVWIYATQPLTSAYMGVYILWTVMTILSTRVYLNLVFLVRQPILEETIPSNARFAGSPRIDRIRMNVQATTSVDIVTIGGGGYGHGHGRRGRRMTLDSTFGFDNIYPVLDDDGASRESLGRVWIPETKADRREAYVLA